MDELAQAVRERAGHACEYCLLPEQNHPGEFFVEAVAFEIEHIIPRQHRGRTVLRNLAFSLNMNHPLRVELRRQLIEEGAFPPRVLGRN